jgi:hypothetical protein
MKKLIYGTMFLAILSTSIFSCKKEIETDSTKTSTAINSSVQKTQIILEILSNEDLLTIGNYHNENLELVFADFNWQSTDFKSELINKFTENQISLRSNDLNYLNERANVDLDANIAILQNELSSTAFTYIQNALTLSNSISNVADFQNTLSQLQENARSNISDVTELNAVLASLEVFKSSAYFWAPVNLGGSGIGYSYWIIYGDIIEQKSPWTNALAADGVSGGIGMLGVAVAGCFGPVGWVALGICGGEAAMSSAASFLF